MTIYNDMLKQLPEEELEALKNTKTGKHFIVVEDGMPNERVRVINPNGDAITVGENLFEIEPVFVKKENFLEFFSEAQLSGYIKYREQKAEEMKRSVESQNTAENAAPDHYHVTTNSTIPKKISRPRSSRANIVKETRGRVVSEWQVSRLTFYRHRILPLKSHQQFRITIENVGSFVMTRDEFESAFNYVLMSEDFRTKGLYSISEIPEALEKFRERK